MTMFHASNLKRTKRSKRTPTTTALCKAPAGIVVVKPAPKSAPLPEPLKTLLPTLPTIRPEHLRPLSSVAVPVARINDRRQKNAPQFTSQPIAKPVIQANAKGPSPRELSDVDITEQEWIADLILDKLKQLNKRASKVTIVCRFNGYFAYGAIVRGLRVLIKQGRVVKQEGNPSLYSLAPIEQAWTTKWTPPIQPTTTGWTTQL